MKLKDDDICDDFFKEYPKDAHYSDQVIWLRNRVPDDITTELYPCILSKHQVDNSDGDFNDMIRAYWENIGEPVFTELKIKNIKEDYFNKQINYEYFIAFNVDSDYDITHKLVGNFKLDPTCYSVPLLEAVYEKYGKEAILISTMGTHEGRDTVIFSIKGSPDSFFDFSQIPPFIGDGKATPV